MALLLVCDNITRCIMTRLWSLILKLLFQLWRYVVSSVILATSKREEWSQSECDMYWPRGRNVVHIISSQDDLFFGYLSIDSVGLLSPTVEQRPSFVLHVTHVYVVAIIFTKGDPGSAKHQEVVAMQNSWTTQKYVYIYLILNYQ